MQTLAELSCMLADRSITSRELVEQALARIEDPNGEGSRAFVLVNATEARGQAEAIDRARTTSRESRPLAGIPISVKDLFDVQGQVTRAGSKVLANNAPAAQDATAVSRLRAAGLIVIGRTNMTEFAYSGLGLNPHYGTPLSPFERNAGRIPGGSSSGAAVSVADGMAAAGIGTDTGGSCRIPAAFCGIVGYKPTARRVDLAGAFPLSSSLDSIGPLARSVDCCARLDAIMAGAAATGSASVESGQLRFGVLKNYVMEGIDGHVSAAFEDALRKLSDHGVQLTDITMPELDELPALNARGGIVAAEAYSVHQKLLDEKADEYDPRVSVRIQKAKEQQPGEYEELLVARSRIMHAAQAVTAQFDAVVMPTTPMVPPRLDVFTDEGEYGRLNLLALRNPTVGNFLDRCAISLPIGELDAPPSGLTLMGEAMADQSLLSIAGQVERVVARSAYRLRFKQ